MHKEFWCGGKTPVAESLFNKIAGLNLIIKEALAQVFRANFANFTRIHFLQNTLSGDCFCT